MICGSGGSKSRLAKAAGAEPAGQMRDKKLHAVVARSTFPSQNVQNTPVSDHFWKLRCRKSARRCGAKHISKSKYTKHTSVGPLLEVEMSKKCTPLWREAHFQATPVSDHFWKLRCRKSACRCGAEHISKSKCTKHTIVGPLLEVEMSNKCTPLWREAHFQVKMYKAQQCRTTFGGSDVGKVQAAVARSTFRSQNVKTPGFWTTFGGSDVASLRFATLHYTTLHSTTLHSTTLHYTTLQLQLHNYTPRHSTTLNYTTLHYITLHYTPLHYTTFHYTSLHYNYNYTTTLHYTTLHYTTLHYTTRHYTTLHYLPLHFTTLHYTTLQYTTTTSTQLHSTTLHHTKLHYATLH